MGLELGKAELLALTGFADADQRRLLVCALQQMGGVIQGGAAEPAGLGHMLAFFQYPVRWSGELHLKKRRQCLPEIRPLLDAPFMQLRVVGQR